MSAEHKRNLAKLKTLKISWKIKTPVPSFAEFLKHFKEHYGVQGNLGPGDSGASEESEGTGNEDNPVRNHLERK
jgi:hypothetical protein